MITTARQALTRGGGAVLEAATHLVSVARRAPKPLHPRGTVWEAELVRSGTSAPVGVPWLDEPGRETAVVRVSAAFGFPHGWPDIQGLAIRLPEHDGADLLLASTGAGRLSRLLLKPVRSSSWHLATSLMPYRGPHGPILFAAAPTEPHHYVLLRAEGLGEWGAFAHLRLVRESVEEPSYDPVRRPLPGLENYDWVTRLRAPAYRRARQDRGELS
ncbi:hypothetical protein [Aeromicrobium flavum]|uniref:hypothetical protein n=1 Tax=Aeromicrobium flavum TaxID=416568 RepID=UPI0031E32608